VKHLQPHGFSIYFRRDQKASNKIESNAHVLYSLLGSFSENLAAREENLIVRRICVS
jgi:hypothetical protein